MRTITRYVAALSLGAALFFTAVGSARAVGSVGTVGGVAFTVTSVKQIGPLILFTAVVYGPGGEMSVGGVIY